MELLGYTLIVVFRLVLMKLDQKYQTSEDAAYVITPKNVLVNLFLAISSAFSPLRVSL